MEQKTTSRWSIVLVILCTLFTALGQLLWKLGVNGLGSGDLLAYGLVLLGFVFYGTGAVLLIFSMRGGELSTIYPFVALGFIWVALLSQFFLSEVMHAMKWFGIATIMAGLVLVGVGSK